MRKAAGGGREIPPEATNSLSKVYGGLQTTLEALAAAAQKILEQQCKLRIGGSTKNKNEKKDTEANLELQV